MTSHQHSRSSDRRRYWRFLGEPLDIHIHVGNKTVKGKLMNESIGGFAFTTEDPAAFTVGQSIVVVIRDEETTAYVRSVRKMLGAKLRVSVSWDKISKPDANTTLDYLAHDNLMLLCEVVGSDDDPIRTVRLWDGAEFQVLNEDVYTRSYDERRDELHGSPSILSTLAQLYGLNSSAEGNEIVSAILEFEFFSETSQKSHRA